MTWLPVVASNAILAMTLALAAWIVQRWLRWHAVAHVLWVLVLVKLVTPPLIQVPLTESSKEHACGTGTCLCSGHRTNAESDRLASILLGVWTAGAGATSWIAWRRWSELRRLTMNASRAPREWQSLADRLAAELAIRRTPEIFAVPGQLPPMAAPGWRRSRIFVPTALIERLDHSQRSVLLLHELFHLKRRDHWLRILELAVRVAYWWLPGIGWVGRQMRICEESCCDAAVVAHRPDERRDYARLLLDVLDFVSPLPATQQATAMNSAGDLERRLRAILNSAQGSRRPQTARLLLVGVACAVIPCELGYDWSRAAAPQAAASIVRQVDVAAPLSEVCEPPRIEVLALCCPG